MVKMPLPFPRLHQLEMPPDQLWSWDLQQLAPRVQPQRPHILRPLDHQSLHYVKQSSLVLVPDLHQHARLDINHHNRQSKQVLVVALVLRPELPLHLLHLRGKICR